MRVRVRVRRVGGRVGGRGRVGVRGGGGGRGRGLAIAKTDVTIYSQL